MPDTQRRVLHGNQEAEFLLDLMARAEVTSLCVPLHSTKGLPVVNEFCRVKFLKLMMNAFKQFYRGTELATRFQSAIAELDAVNRTIILKHVRLKHRRKDLPKEVHDLRVY